MTPLKKIALQILTQAEAMEELENQLHSLTDTAIRYDLGNCEISGIRQDIKSIKAAEIKTMYALIKEAHLLTRGFEIKDLPKPKDVKKSVIFIHSSHNSEVAKDFRA